MRYAKSNQWHDLLKETKVDLGYGIIWQDILVSDRRDDFILVWPTPVVYIGHVLVFNGQAINSILGRWERYYNKWITLFLHPYAIKGTQRAENPLSLMFTEAAIE